MTNEEYHRQCKSELGHDIIALYDFVVLDNDRDHIYQIVEDSNTHMGYADNKTLWVLRAFDVETMKYSDKLLFDIPSESLTRIPQFFYLLQCKSKCENSFLIKLKRWINKIL